MTSYRVVHRTEYRYESRVSASYGEAHLSPRDHPGQTCRASRIEIDPQPLDRRERLDFFGNRTLYFDILEPHTTLTVAATSFVDVTAAPAVPLLADQWWEVARDRVADGTEPELVAAREYRLESPSVPALPVVAEYAEPSFRRGRPLVDAIVELTGRIHEDFAYEPGSTVVTTTLDEVMARRAGVCQDFTHVLIGCLRSVGLAARYVSGYVETEPPPGQERLQGADVSHAWASVMVPGAGWVDLDPTNNQLVNDRYITTGWGRDYADVPPLKGVIYTDGDHELHVTVDVVPVAG